MKKSFLPLSRFEGIVVQELADETLIYDLETNRALCLNETSTLVWKSCDGTKSVADISLELSEKTKAKIPEDLVYLALDQLKGEDLLTNGENLDARFGGTSRREAIKRLGLATAVALPIISSLLAPTVASAQSAGAACLPSGSTCPGVDPCCPGTTCQTNTIGTMFLPNTCR